MNFQQESSSKLFLYSGIVQVYALEHSISKNLAFTGLYASNDNKICKIYKGLLFIYKSWETSHET